VKKISGVISLITVVSPCEIRARVHFIPDLKVGVFVTLRAPAVIEIDINGPCTKIGII
jgi:hypothetical protein